MSATIHPPGTAPSIRSALAKSSGWLVTLWRNDETVSALPNGWLVPTSWCSHEDAPP